MSTESIKRQLDARPDLRGDLFVRGFLVTDDPDVAAGDAFPFYVPKALPNNPGAGIRRGHSDTCTPYMCRNMSRLAVC